MTITEQPTPPPQRLYSPEQVAHMFAISRSSVYELIRDGELESLFVGRLRRIPSEAIEDFVAARRASQGTNAYTTEEQP